MMPNFELTDVDSKLVGDIAVNIDDYISALQSVYKTIESGVMPNLTPCWQGKAKENFEQKLTTFALELSKLIKGYSDLNWQLRKAGTAYGEADDSVRQVIAKLPK